MNSRWAPIRFWTSRLCLLMAPLWCTISRADDTWTYAVQLSAKVQANPPRISLSWPADPYGASSYTVYRKLKDADTWGSGTVLPGSATNAVDENVTVGGSYEYQVLKQGMVGYVGYGYIYAGIEHPAQEQRGKVILLVAADTAALSIELSRLEEDLVGDGWQVIRHDVSPAATPASVRNLVVSDYNDDPAQVQAVFLFGQVPILMSGNIEYDSHGQRPMPADAFYGDVDGNWSPEAEPSARPSYMPSRIELMVGRVDFHDMPGNGAPTPWPNETGLLRRYLNKDHAWRHKQTIVPRRAIMGNRVGDAGGLAYAASGYRNFEPFVGPGNIAEANVSDTGPNAERWISMLSSGSYLWSYGCGGGQANVISHLGIHGTYKEVWSTDLVAQDAKAVFSMLFGSHFGEWTQPDNVLRAMIAAPGVSLTACLAGLPHWYVHHMGLGETIGYGTRLTMNNETLYKSHANLLTRCVLINLLGDPTLRMEPLAPPRSVAGAGQDGSATLNWTASEDTVIGYHVYRSAARLGPYTRLTATPVKGTSFVDSAAFQSSRHYMVRAVGLQSNPSGSYYNLSHGSFASVMVSTTPLIASTVILTPAGPQLTWNSEPGNAYHVEGMVLTGSRGWTNLSGTIVAGSGQTSFTDPDWISYWSRFYRVVRE